MNWSTRYASEKIGIAAPANGTSVLGNPAKTIGDATNKFYDNGGSIEVHHFDENTPVQPNSSMSQKFHGLLAKVKAIDVPDSITAKARDWLSTGISRLADVYSTGQHPKGALPTRTMFLAKDHKGNAIGHLAIAPSEDGSSQEVLGLSSLSSGSGAPYALQHALLQHLAGTGQSLTSHVEHHSGPKVRDNALRFHQNIGRRIGLGRSKYKSTWTPEDVHSLNSNIQIGRQNIEHFGLS